MMKCTSCGKEVPKEGTICPYCQTPRGTGVAGVIAGFIYLAVAAIGFSRDWWGIKAGLIGFFVAFIGTAALDALVSSSRAADDLSPENSSSSAPIAERLATLGSLRDQGLINDTEFAEKKKALLEKV